MSIKPDKRDEEIEKARKLRQEFTLKCLKRFPEKPGELSCYGCGNMFIINDRITWHVTGFTFHPECLAKEK